MTMGCCAAASALITVLVEKFWGFVLFCCLFFNKKLKFLFHQDLNEHTVRATFRSTMGRG